MCGPECLECPCPPPPSLFRPALVLFLGRVPSFGRFGIIWPIEAVGWPQVQRYSRGGGAAVA